MSATLRASRGTAGSVRGCRSRTRGLVPPRRRCTRSRCVEVHFCERPEKDVPVHLSLSDVEVLVHARGRAGRVHYAHGGLTLVLVRTRPSVQRQYGSDLHAGCGQRLLERRDLCLVRPRVQEEWHEARAWRQLHVVIVQVRDETGQLGQRDATEHVGVECDLHHGLTAPSGKSRGVRAGTPWRGCRSAAPRDSFPRRRWLHSRPRNSGRSTSQRPRPPANPATPHRRYG